MDFKKESESECITCGVSRPVGDMLYDERAEHYLCSRECYYEWTDANFEVVGGYYADNNISGG